MLQHGRVRARAAKAAMNLIGIGSAASPREPERANGFGARSGRIGPPRGASPCAHRAANASMNRDLRLRLHVVLDVLPLISAIARDAGRVRDGCSERDRRASTAAPARTRGRPSRNREARRRHCGTASTCRAGRHRRTDHPRDVRRTMVRHLSPRRPRPSGSVHRWSGAPPCSKARQDSRPRRHRRGDHAKRPAVGTFGSPAAASPTYSRSPSKSGRALGRFGPGADAVALHQSMEAHARYPPARAVCVSRFPAIAVEQRDQVSRVARSRSTESASRYGSDASDGVLPGALSGPYLDG